MATTSTADRNTARARIRNALSPLLDRLELASRRIGSADCASSIGLGETAVRLLNIHEVQWDLEDACRSADLDSTRGELKARIDESNAHRVACINEIDRHTLPGLSATEDAPLAWPLTPGQAIDSLLILALKTYRTVPQPASAVEAYLHSLKCFEILVSLIETHSVTLPPASTKKQYAGKPLDAQRPRRANRLGEVR